MVVKTPNIQGSTKNLPVVLVSHGIISLHKEKDIIVIVVIKTLNIQVQQIFYLDGSWNLMDSFLYTMSKT